jgi:hypothetical protein
MSDRGRLTAWQILYWVFLVYLIGFAVVLAASLLEEVFG